LSIGSLTVTAVPSPNSLSTLILPPVQIDAALFTRVSVACAQRPFLSSRLDALVVISAYKRLLGSFHIAETDDRSKQN
jgi:hypothetical protein